MSGISPFLQVISVHSPFELYLVLGEAGAALDVHLLELDILEVGENKYLGVLGQLTKGDGLLFGVQGGDGQQCYEEGGNSFHGDSCLFNGILRLQI